MPETALTKIWISTNILKSVLVLGLRNPKVTYRDCSCCARGSCAWYLWIRISCCLYACVIQLPSCLVGSRVNEGESLLSLEWWLLSEGHCLNWSLSAVVGSGWLSGVLVSSGCWKKYSSVHRIPTNTSLIASLPCLICVIFLQVVLKAICVSPFELQHEKSPTNNPTGGGI